MSRFQGIERTPDSLSNVDWDYDVFGAFGTLDQKSNTLSGEVWLRFSIEEGEEVQVGLSSPKKMSPRKGSVESVSEEALSAPAN